jgi:LAS superfamily LD-carboxypeptidase LdcB
MNQSIQFAVKFIAILVFAVLGIQGGSQAETSLHCVNKQDYSVRIATFSAGCVLGEVSLGRTAIKAPKSVIKGLHPKVELRFKAARAAAKLEGVTLYISSGFRTLERQRYLFNRALKRHGSYEEAIKWVAPAEISRHPRGLAMDINYPGDPMGAKWLEIYGYRYGLCRVFENEWWHFEAVTVPGETCPVMYENSATRG